MRLYVENSKLIPTINLLQRLSLKGTQSRHRTKLVKELAAHTEEVSKQEYDLIKEHAVKDSEGNPKMTNDDKSFEIENMDAFVKDSSELHKEKFIIEGSNFQEPLQTIRDVLINSEEEWNGQEADIYDYLCDQLENAK
jgi:Protein of unknown function (DUF1617)